MDLNAIDLTKVCRTCLKEEEEEEIELVEGGSSNVVVSGVGGCGGTFDGANVTVNGCTNDDKMKSIYMKFNENNLAIYEMITACTKTEVCSSPLIIL